MTGRQDNGTSDAPGPACSTDDSGDLFALLRATTPHRVQLTGGETAAQDTSTGLSGDLRDPLPHDAVVGSVETPVGFLTLGLTARGVAACSFEAEDQVAARLGRSLPNVGRAEARLDPVRSELAAYFEGRLRSFTVPLDLRLASDFGKVVLRSLLDVGYGETTTERELAQRSGQANARRAVVNTVRTNPLCVLLPCHRVVPDDYPQRLGGYAGGGEAKQYLLNLEETRIRRRSGAGAVRSGPG
ncbi:methylated-DNA--[protein]-cysteine S-methyltransferase [Lipingzhangella sp. LS1_29]|uniref:Methylated-DNA--[protein]-cysteine S-methyltransferase n=1 Tax=Lipingzhangella rawalii TaxID=2055835 RepID=A0ABU2H8P3_9ACTN|nr:methylated-DNA--[protein]-cysteine S-methyltransferase [Lipingzhangella rawalii]MDS1271664.1 methylated-DNA--[protein]-cysteine S-methyltransferase [Lipingzhangella rawalii]